MELQNCLMAVPKKQPSLKLGEDFFARFKKSQRFKKNQLIFGPGAEPSGVFYVKSGFVRLYLVSSEGKEITFNILKPGSYFSMIWALNDVANIYFYESLTDVLLLKAPKDEVVKYVKDNPKLAYDLARRSLSGLDGLTRLMEALLTGNANEQIASVLLILSRRFGKETADGIVIDILLTHRVIGTMAGLSRESTSLEMEKLEKNKIISQKNRSIVIKDLKKLIEISPIGFVEESVF
jgi:CRP/FNR family transcriptional regulator, cyclic AMP receptor protein